MKSIIVFLVTTCTLLGETRVFKGRAVEGSESPIEHPVVDPIVFENRMQQMDEELFKIYEGRTEEKKEIAKRLNEIFEDRMGIVSTNDKEISQDESSYEGPYAKTFFQGDIVLTEEQLEFITSSGNESRTKRQAQKNSWYPSNLWLNEPIPYSFAAGFPSNRIAPVRAAISFWEEHTCIRFQENGTGRDRIEFINGNGCWSMIGKTGGQQSISIGYGCDWIGIIAHEIEHAFGIWHTQTRFDRDYYVYINTENVLRNQMHNFNIQNQAFTDLYGLPYEFGSVMHYYEYDFAFNRSHPTVVTRRGYERFQHSMANYLPSFYDVHLINSYYKCYDKCPNNISCENGGRQDVNNCSVCKCAPGFTGVRCELISTSGCDRNYTVGPEYINISATAGSSGLYEVGYTECNIHLKPTEVGKRIEVIVNSGAGYSSWNCYGAGVDVRVHSDPAMSGVRLCHPWTRFNTLYSDVDRLVLKLFARINYVDFAFTVRSF